MKNNDLLDSPFDDINDDFVEGEEEDDLDFELEMPPRVNFTFMSHTHELEYNEDTGWQIVDFDEDEETLHKIKHYFDAKIKGIRHLVDLTRKKAKRAVVSHSITAFGAVDDAFGSNAEHKDLSLTEKELDLLCGRILEHLDEDEMIISFYRFYGDYCLGVLQGAQLKELR